VALGTEWRPPRSATAADDLTSAVFGAQQGLDTAFSHAYRLVQPGLLRYLTVLVAGDAEDVASETWLQVCRDLHTFTGDGDGFRGWVTTIARHRALDHLRARGRRPADPATPETLHGLVASDDTAHQAEESLSTAAALGMIRSLPQDQAEAVLLRAVVGLDAKSAGRVLAKRPGAVRTAAHRGLRTLERQLQDGQRR
jgi:RNA polymerase sigma-70 factor (ECF subfamily)